MLNRNKREYSMEVLLEAYKQLYKRGIGGISVYEEEPDFISMPVYNNGSKIGEYRIDPRYFSVRTISRNLTNYIYPRSLHIKPHRYRVNYIEEPLKLYPRFTMDNCGKYKLLSFSLFGKEVEFHD